MRFSLRWARTRDRMVVTCAHQALSAGKAARVGVLMKSGERFAGSGASKCGDAASCTPLHPPRNLFLRSASAPSAQHQLRVPMSTIVLCITRLLDELESQTTANAHCPLSSEAIYRAIPNWQSPATQGAQHVAHDRKSRPAWATHDGKLIANWQQRLANLQVRTGCKTERLCCKQCSVDALTILPQRKTCAQMLHRICCLTHRVLQILWNIRDRMQVADFLDDRVMVECEAAALGRAYYAADESDKADALGDAVLALPHHLLHAAFRPLVAARELPVLLHTLPSALHSALLAAYVQHGSGEDFEADSEDDIDGCSSQCGADDGGTGVGRVLQLRREVYTSSALAALFTCVPCLPPLGAVVNRAALPAAELTHALAAHSTMTRLRLDDAAIGEAEVSANALAQALPCWPRLASLRLHHSSDCSRKATATAAASDLLAPALASVTALTSLNLSRLRVTPKLVRALAGLTQLAELRLRACSYVQAALLQLTSWAGLRTLCVQQHISHHGPAHTTALHGLSTCASLEHLDLRENKRNCDVWGMEFAALSQLESLRLRGLHDSSLQQPGEVLPFDAHDPACRRGVRALPHLAQLTALTIPKLSRADVDEGGHEVLAVSAALPLLTRLVRLHLSDDGGRFSGTRALAVGWSCAPALRALTCFIYDETTLLHGAHASARTSLVRLRGLTSLDVTFEHLGDFAEELVDDVEVIQLPWLSSQIAQLSALCAIRIASTKDVPHLAALPTLVTLSVATGLRRLEMIWVDLRGAEWGAMPLCALTALLLCCCHAPHAMSSLAPRTKLSYLRLRNCDVVPDDVSAFVQLRGRALAGAPVPRPHLELDLRGGPYSLMRCWRCCWVRLSGSGCDVCAFRR